MDLETDDPQTLGRYRVMDHLRTSAVGRVLLGVDDTGRSAELTVVHRELAADETFRERFRHGVRSAATAPPWFSTPVLDADPDAERPWLATARVEGPSLHTYVDGRGPLGKQGTLALADRMAAGLVALHGVGLAHGDLTPANIVLADDGPRLIGTGVSRAADPKGTPGFASPEAAAGAVDSGPAGDMFGFGTMIVFAATGRSPFAADSADGALHRVVHAEPDLGPIDGGLHDIVAGCLAKDPAARPTAEQVRDALRPTVAPVPPAPSRVPALPTGPHEAAAQRTRNRRAAVVLAALVGVAVAVTLIVVLTGGNEPAAGPTVAGPPAPTSEAPSDSGRSTTAAPSPSATAAPETRPDPAAGASLVDIESDPRFAGNPAGSATFATPSGNIVCRMDVDGVRCDVLENTWDLPPRPADCTQGWGTGTVLRGSGTGELSCVSDVVGDPPFPTLGYDEAIELGGAVCVSRETGMRCESRASGHGFEVARGDYSVY